MANIVHSQLTLADIHALTRWQHVDATERLAESLVAADVGKVSHQLDDDTYWILVDLVPTWSQLNAAGGGGGDHGGLTGLGDDDHTQYLLADGTRELTDDMTVTALKTIDGRDLSVDGAKLDGIEAGAELGKPAFSFRWSGLSGTGAPTPGQILTSHAAAASCNAIEISNTDLDGFAHSGLQLELTDNDRLILRKRGDYTVGGHYELGTNTTQVGYRQLIVGQEGGQGTFIDGDTIDVWYIRGTENFVDVDGTRAQDAVLLTERPDHVNTPAAGSAELWIRNDALQQLVLTDDAGDEHEICRIAAGVTNNYLLMGDGGGANGALRTTTLKHSAGQLQLDSTTASLDVRQRATGPSLLASYSKIWTRDDAPSTLMHTDDTGIETILSPGHSAATLGAAATTFAIASTVMTITGDGGANTVATITGAGAGQLLTLIFVDALVTITDTDAHTADTIDLSAAFTSAADTTLQLVYNGTSWYEISRSVN